MIAAFTNLAHFYNESIPFFLSKNTFKSSPRGIPCHEVIGTVVKYTDPQDCIYENEHRPYNYQYLAGELNWYLDGDPSVAGILPYSKFWGNITNPDNKTINSNYGWLLFKKENMHGGTQWQWAYNALVNDLATRQAIMYLGGPDYQFEENRDFVCTSSIQFFVRANKLHMKVDQRSCDIFFGLPYDLPFFSLLQQNMLILLNHQFPGMNIELGELVHQIGSLHMYERNEDKMEEAQKSGFYSPRLLELKQPLVDEFGNRMPLLPEACPVHKLINDNALKGATQ